MDLIFARRHPGAVYNRFPIAPQEPLAGGAHGAPYLQTTVYVCSRVGCAVRTRVFRRPAAGLRLAGFPWVAGGTGINVKVYVREKDGAVATHGSHLRKAPSGGSAQPFPHRSSRAPRRWCARRTLRTNNRLRVFAGRVRRAHQGFPPTWLRGSASPVAVGRGRDGYDREGQGPGEGWPHPAHGPIFATSHQGAVHNRYPISPN